MHGSGVVMLWREVEGKPGVLDLSGQPFAARAQSIDEVSVLEQPLKRGVTSITFAPREVKFVKVNLK